MHARLSPALPSTAAEGSEKTNGCRGASRPPRRLKAVAERDGLTGLLGVGAFKNEAQTLVDRNNVGAFVVVDIDDFKVVNDTYGHKAGDESLCLLARATRSFLRTVGSPPVYR